MTPALLVLLTAASALAAFGQNNPECLPVSGDFILGRDLASVVPELAVIAPAAPLGYAPAAGVQRTYLGVQIQQMAARYGVHAVVRKPVCFAWPLQPLTKDQLVAAMQKALPGRHVDLDVTDQSKFAAPAGELTFPPQALSGDSDKPAVWTGFVTYGGKRKFATWARVRITVHEKHLVAIRAIGAGESVAAGAIKAIDYSGPLNRSSPPCQEESEVTGKLTRWVVPEGTTIAQNMLIPPTDVDKEQLVTVHIDTGAAHVQTQAIAAEAGYKGNVIRVRNAKTGKVFRGRIDDKGVVTVVPGGFVGLVGEDKKS